MRRDAYKRWFDLTVLILAHIVLSPLLPVLFIGIPLLIWAQDSGPVLFRQRRSGKDGRNFTVFKFRTMATDAVRKGPPWTTTGDSRVTPFGRILRRRALDELPQVFNIWKGDMSLVGPRALPVAEQRLLEQRIPGFAERLKARPGLAGPAQVYNPTDDPHIKLRLDLEYIERMSPWLDVKILFLAVLKSVLGQVDRREGKAGQETEPHDHLSRK